ncbi:uncharacterized protein LOC116139115 [Pistacia vera]|uniref:uncharacterized protein LOC116139115 n=1 Tax=Pistacia vera TaxID=55513 RepID=UPI001262DB9E|nr:uncharacterized protein LOC116139115 [Pistacia vera]
MKQARGISPSLTAREQRRFGFYGSVLVLLYSGSTFLLALQGLAVVSRSSPPAIHALVMAPLSLSSPSLTLFSFYPPIAQIPDFLPFFLICSQILFFSSAILMIKQCILSQSEGTSKERSRLLTSTNKKQVNLLISSADTKTSCTKP